MPVILQPDIGPDLGQGLEPNQNILFLSTVTALRGANSIEQIATAALQSLTVVECVIDTNLQFWQLQPGTGTLTDTNNVVTPLDNAAIHWQRVGGFGVTLMASARITKAAAQTLNNNQTTAIAFDAARFNSGEWSSTSNPSRITALVDGIYSLSGSVSFAANVTGQRSLSLRLNGATEIARQQVNAASALVPINLEVSSIYKLTANDYIELVALQTSGSTLDVLKTNQYSPELASVRLSSLTPLETDPTDATPPVADTTGNDVVAFSVPQAGWYRIWAGAYPASGNFNIVRTLQEDGQTSDTVVDFTIIGDTPEGIINVSRNSVPSTGSPSIDGVRVSHSVSAALGYVAVHLLRGGSWSLTRPASDTNYLDAPYLVPDVQTDVDASLVYSLKPNVTGGTGTIDVPQVSSGGNKLLIPPSIANPWVAATGTPARTAFDTASATLTQVAQRLKAIIDDLIYAGVFQAGLPSTMLYSDMLALAASLIAENSVANLTDIFRVSVAPDTTVQGIYTPVGTFNGKNFYKIQGYEYEVAGQNSARQCYWSSAWATWTISNGSGNLYHSGAAEANPWAVAQWKNQAAGNVAVTTVPPNIAMTYNALSDTHTAQVILGSTSGYTGIYLRGADLNAKRSYYQVGTGTNNKRIEWTGAAWNIKDDSATYATSSEAVTYPDQVTAWVLLSGSDAISVSGVDAVNLMSGITLGGNATYNGVYVPVQGVYNILGGRNLVYRRTDGAYVIANDGAFWHIGPYGGPYPVQSDSNGVFPWNASWTTASLTLQQNKIASPGWVNGVSQGNITGNVTGNWHI